MKLPLAHARLHRGRHSGSAVIVVMALLAIILVYVAANLRTLYLLSAELRLLERQQIQRLQGAAPATSSPAAAGAATNRVPSAPNIRNQ